MGLPKLGWLKILKISTLAWSESRSRILNCLRRVKSICVAPKPRRAFRPSVPCRGVLGMLNAAGLISFPPATLGSAIQSGAP